MKSNNPALEREFQETVSKTKKNSKSSADTDVDSRPSKRMTVVLPFETSEMLQALSSMQSITLNEAIRRAISTEAFIRNEIGKGSRILVKTDEGETKELIFR